MAEINTLIAELRTIAGAHPTIETFRFDSVFSTNAFHDTTYPLMLVDENPEMPLNMSEQIAERTWAINMKWFFYDTYKQAEQDSTAYEEKVAELMNIAEQYTKEFIDRYIENGSDWEILNEDSISGFPARDVNNDKLVQLVIEPQILLKTDCDVATFTY